MRKHTPMLDVKRQENISNPSSIFEKFRLKAPRKEEGERQRIVLKPGIPRVDDEEIIELCKRYPVKLNEDSHNNKNNDDKMKTGAQLNMQRLQLDAQKKQVELVRNIEKSLTKWKK